MTKLKNFREDRGLSRTDLMRLSGVKRNLLAMQEKNGIKTVRVAKRYAAALNCNPLELIEL